MKLIALVIASMFAVSAFAVESAKAPVTSAPAKAEAKKEAKKPAKSHTAKKDTKAATPAPAAK
jgi:hypothetical protein